MKNPLFLYLHLLLLSLLAATASAQLTAKEGARGPDTNALTYPNAIDPKAVGSYPKVVKSGGGVFYDEVLEYRVWVFGEDGDTFKAFATFEEAEKFSKHTKGAEEPLVLVRQFEHVNEPSPGIFEHKKETRLAEWRVSWLPSSKRLPDSIEKYIASGGKVKNGVLRKK